MRVLKNIFSQLHSFVLCLLLSIIFWGWIFSMATDAPFSQKVTIYCDVPQIQDTALAAELEESMPEGLKRIQVHSFAYVMMDMGSINRGDIFILPASEIETYREGLAPVLGQPGIQVYDAATGEGVAQDYIVYGDEDYYLFLGSGSAHLEDGKALEVIRMLIKLE